jgi:hypothetical protein
LNTFQLVSSLSRTPSCAEFENGSVKNKQICSLENENWQNGTCVGFKHASEYLADRQLGE